MKWGSPPGEMDALRVFEGKEGSPCCGLMAMDNGGAKCPDTRLQSLEVGWQSFLAWHGGRKTGI